MGNRYIVKRHLFADQKEGGWHVWDTLDNRWAQGRFPLGCKVRYGCEFATRTDAREAAMILNKKTLEGSK